MDGGKAELILTSHRKKSEGHQLIFSISLPTDTQEP